MGPTFTIVTATDLPPPTAWRRLLDLRRHDQLIPLTHLPEVPAVTELRVGTSFVARTGIGPFGFDDPMTISEWSPPLLTGTGAGRAELTKTGRVIGGRVAIELRPWRAGTVIRWTQQVRLPLGLSRPALPLLRAGYRLAIKRLLDSADPSDHQP